MSLYSTVETQCHCESCKAESEDYDESHKKVKDCKKPKKHSHCERGPRGRRGPTGPSFVIGNRLTIQNLRVTGDATVGGDLTTNDVIVCGQLMVDSIIPKASAKVTFPGDVLIQGRIFNAAINATQYAHVNGGDDALIYPIPGYIGSTLTLLSLPCSGLITNVDANGVVTYSTENVCTLTGTPFIDVYQYSINDSCNIPHTITQLICFTPQNVFPMTGTCTMPQMLPVSSVNQLLSGPPISPLPTSYEWDAIMANTSDPMASGVVRYQQGERQYVSQFYTGSGGVVFNEDGSIFKTFPNIPGSFNSIIASYDNNGFGAWASYVTNILSTGQMAVNEQSGEVLFLGTFFGSNPATIYNSDDTVFLTYPMTLRGAVLINYNGLTGMVNWALTILDPTLSINVTGIYLSINNVTGDIYVNGNRRATKILDVTNSDGSPAFTIPADPIGNTFNPTQWWAVKFNAAGFGQWRIYWFENGLATDYNFGGVSTYNATNSQYYTSQNDTLTGPPGVNSFTLYNSDDTIGFSTNNQSRPACVWKYNSNGFFEWFAGAFISDVAKSGGKAGYWGVSVDQTSGDVYCGGGISGNASGIPISWLNSDGTTFLTQNYLRVTGVVAKYNINGMTQWMAFIEMNLATTSGTPTMAVTAVNVDLCGNVIARFDALSSAGNTATVKNSDGTVFATVSMTGASSTALFIKYDSSGNVIWIIRVRNGGSFLGTTTCAVDDICGDLYLSLVVNSTAPHTVDLIVNGGGVSTLSTIVGGPTKCLIKLGFDDMYGVQIPDFLSACNFNVTYTAEECTTIYGNSTSPFTVGVLRKNGTLTVDASGAIILQNGFTVVY